MSHLPPLSSPSLTRRRLAEILSSEVGADPYPHLLRWLVWFPLLSAQELTRLEQARLAKRAQTRSPQRVAAHLQVLEAFHLIAHVVVNETNWPPHQHRYFLTDLGIDVFAAQSEPPLSVPRVAQAYAVERVDLLNRLAQIDIHMVLADFSTRLVAQGHTHRFLLTSFQQPWTQTDTIFGHRQTFRSDAAFLLATPQGTEHAFYVRVDVDERRPFDPKQERLPLLHLLALRHALHLRRETMPCLLIISSAAHLSAWGILLEHIRTQRRVALLDGAITTLERLRRCDVHGPIWWTFAQLVQGMDAGLLTELTAPSRTLASLQKDPVSHTLAERFSQRETFAHLATGRRSGPFRTSSRPLPSSVGKSLTNEIVRSHGAALSDALSGTKAEQQEATVLLNLTLSAMQKDLLFWLAHHPLLTLHQLAALQRLVGRGRRGVQQQLSRLSALNLLVPFVWDGPRPWHERERYLLAEPALRYVALREGKPSTSYLLPPEERKAHETPALALQRGSSGLFAQMEHTHGLYESMGRLLKGTSPEHVRLVAWKSAHEAMRWYRDPFTNTLMQIRPDAEVLYHVKDRIMPQSLLIEYDRATTGKREYEAKFQSYADYLAATHLALPPLLVITPSEQAARLIRSCIDHVGRTLSVTIVLEAQVHYHLLLSV